MIIGSPTYNANLYPGIEALLSKILLREVKGRFFGYFGSFTWAGMAVKKMAEFVEKSKFELVGEPIEFKQAMKGDDFEKAAVLAEAMAKALGH